MRTFWIPSKLFGTTKDLANFWMTNRPCAGERVGCSGRFFTLIKTFKRRGSELISSHKRNEKTAKGDGIEWYEWNEYLSSHSSWETLRWIQMTFNPQVRPIEIQVFLWETSKLHRSNMMEGVWRGIKDTWWGTGGDNEGVRMVETLDTLKGMEIKFGIGPKWVSTILSHCILDFKSSWLTRMNAFGKWWRRELAKVDFPLPGSPTIFIQSFIYSIRRGSRGE